jgi:hypothetical protein
MTTSGSTVTVSWVYSGEDEPIARELLRLAGVLQRLGTIRNQPVSTLEESLLHTSHTFGDGIAVFLVSPAALEDPRWGGLLQDALQDPRTRTVMVLVRPVAAANPPDQARRVLVLPADGVPIATRRDREDAMLEVIQGVQELAVIRRSSRGAPHRGRLQDVSINDIFRLNGPPTVTFVEPPRFLELQAELRTMGTGLIVEGPAKTGKSTAIARAMDDLEISAADQLWWTAQKLPPFEEFERVLDELRGSRQRRWLFIDDFHYLEDSRYLRELAFAMKALADQARSYAKVTLVGINPLGESLVRAMPDLSGRFRIMRTDRERDPERNTLLTELIALGERAANIRFLRRDEFVVAAGGSFYIAQLLCNRAASQAGIYTTPKHTVEIEQGPADVIAAIRDELAARYRTPMLHFAAFDLHPPPRGAGLSLLWLLTRSTEGFVSLKEARLRFPSLASTFDWFLQSNLSRCFEDHPELRGLLYFNRATGTLAMEDPQLSFYLRALDWTAFGEASGHGHIVFHPADGPLWSPAEQPLVTGVRRVERPGTTGAKVRRLLHLSDLHFATPVQVTSAYSRLAADLRQQGIERLDALVVSGDLVNWATADEYAAAGLFIEQLKSGFELKAQAIVLVPGNHDVSWTAGDSAYRLMKRAQHAGELVPGTYVMHKPEIIEVRDEDAYLQRFAAFAELFERLKGEPYPLAYEDQATLTVLPDAGWCILGLNSAWETDRYFSNRVSLHMGALARALDRLPAPAPGELRIATFHHPIHSDEPSRILDAAFLQQLAVAGFQLVLHGHVHRADAALYRYDRTAGGRQIDIITAGTFGAPVPAWVPGYPLQYNLLAIDEAKIVVETRCRREINGAWEPDARWLQGAGHDPLPRYTIERRGG